VTLEAVPTEAIAGDTWAWILSLDDYPAGTWTATIYFENKQKSFNVAGSASGTNHSFAIAAGTTATYPRGRYQWRLRVTDGTTTSTIDDGWLDVEPNPAGAGTRDVRSWARRTLDAIEAFLEGNATTAQQSMSIQGRSLARWPLEELRKFRTELRNEVRTEEQGLNAGTGRNIKARFKRA
jgi:hypothetical protein